MQTSPWVTRHGGAAGWVSMGEHKAGPAVWYAVAILRIADALTPCRAWDNRGKGVDIAAKNVYNTV